MSISIKSNEGGYMSCRAMGGMGELILIGSLLVVYGCGPNVIVGAGGAAVTGVLALKDKVNRCFLESRLESNSDEYVRRDLSIRIRVLDESEQANLTLCSKFAWSMIPIVGPIIAVTSSSLVH
jgi:hypothetical protein